MWLSGPITTVHYGHICQELAAVARVGLTTRRWLSDKSRSAAMVLGNHPISVRRIKGSLPSLLASGLSPPAPALAGAFGLFHRLCGGAEQALVFAQRATHKADGVGPDRQPVQHRSILSSHYNPAANWHCMSPIPPLPAGPAGAIRSHVQSSTRNAAATQLMLSSL